MDVLDKEELEREYAWLEYFQSVVDPKLVVLPRPLRPLITTERLVIVVMEFIDGTTAKAKIENCKLLSDVDADRITKAYLALQKAAKPMGDKLSPPSSGSWYLNGHIFSPYTDGELIKHSWTDFKAYMDDRLTKTNEGEAMTLPEGRRAYVNGGISPYDTIFTEDGRVAFLDHEMAFFAPYDWDIFAMHISPYAQEFTIPVIKALERQGLRMREDRKEIYEKFMRWHARCGLTTAM